MSILDDLEIPADSNLNVVAGLLLLITADPSGVSERLAKFKDAAAEARDLIEQANKATANLALERAQHAEAMDALSRRQASDHEGRLHEARNILAAAESEKREADEKLQRAHAIMHAAENRAADLQQRYSGAK
jgi:gas vesicle protein